MTHASTRHDAIARRILDAAGPIFAERGFRQTTVRDICRRARVNVAAINYYYGDKRRLYAAALKHGRESALLRFPPDRGLGAHPSPDERLHAFVHSFLSRFLAVGQPEWYGKLCMREMAEPSGVLDDLVNEMVRPMFERLRKIVRDLLGRGATNEQVRLCALSVVGQCMHYYYARSVLQRLFPRRPVDARAIEPIARHITQFSLSAIRRMSRSKESR